VPDRVFTVAEANSALHEVRPAVERLVTARARLRELEQAQGALVTAIGGNGAGYAASDLNMAQAEFQRLAELAREGLERLNELGVIVKDLDAGLVDFPARRAGADVLLCWQAGEDLVAYWHPLDEGFASRKPIDWDEEEARGA